MRPSLRQRYSLIALVCFALAPLLGAAIYLLERMPSIGDPTAQLRMSIPNAQRVQLAVGHYGVYYGAAGRMLFGAPALDLDLVPPDGVEDPRFEPTSRAAQKQLADGTTFVELGRLEIVVAGRYTARVRGAAKPGTSFAIGELPVDPPASPPVVHGVEIFVGELLFALLLAWLNVRGQRDKTAAVTAPRR